MNSALIQLLVLAAIAVFLVLRLRNVLGTRDGYEPPAERTGPTTGGPARDFEVIEGGPDLDITDHVPADSTSGKALAEMKRLEPSFGVSDFLQGARGAYEMIVMGYERGDLKEIQKVMKRSIPVAGPASWATAEMIDSAPKSKNGGRGGGGGGRGKGGGGGRPGGGGGGGRPRRSGGGGAKPAGSGRPKRNRSRGKAA